MSTSVNEDLLTIYLNDHLAGATGGVELAKRAADENSDSDLGKFLGELALILEEDRESIRTLMSSRGMSENPVKIAGGWVAEKLGRLKLNGQLTGYSPLSRVVELEGLLSGSVARAGVFELLAAICDIPEGKSFTERAQRAHEHTEQLRLHLQSAYETAFVSS